LNQRFEPETIGIYPLLRQSGAAQTCVGAVALLGWKISEVCIHQLDLVCQSTKLWTVLAQEDSYPQEKSST
jgi:hypothetical protein